MKTKKAATPSTSITDVAKLLTLMNEQGCNYLELENVKLQVANPMRASLKRTLEQEPSGKKLPPHKAMTAQMDKELFPELYPADEITEDEFQ